MKTLLAAFLVLGLTACGEGPRGADGSNGSPGLPGAPAPIPVPPVVDEVQADIAAVLGEENEYRLSLGQTMLSEGLSCTVQAISAGQWLSSSSPGYNSGQGVVAMTGPAFTYLYKGLFNQPDSSAGPNALLPVAIQPMFASANHRISCSGQVVVLETGYYSFSLNSDDGSILTVNGTQVINNDGNHGMTLKSGTVFLRRGVRSFSLLYAQTGAGNFGLVLKANGASIEGRFYAH